MCFVMSGQKSGQFVYMKLATQTLSLRSLRVKAMLSWSTRENSGTSHTQGLGASQAGFRLGREEDESDWQDKGSYYQDSVLHSGSSSLSEFEFHATVATVRKGRNVLTSRFRSENEHSNSIS
jgi:hypothetical protein